MLRNKSVNTAKELCAVIFTWVVHDYVVVCCQGTASICPAVLIISLYHRLMSVPLATPTIPPTYGQPRVIAHTETRSKSRHSPYSNIFT